MKKKKKSEGKLSEKDEMGEKEKNAIEAQLAKEAEIRNRLKEVSFLFLHMLHSSRQNKHLKVFIVSYEHARNGLSGSLVVCFY